MSDPDQNDLAGPPESRDTLEIGRLQDDALHDVHTELQRTKGGPRTGFRATPIALMFLFGVLVFVGGIYTAHFSVGFDRFAFDETQGVKGGPVKPPTPLTMFEVGEKVFRRNCVACHQSSGMGLPGAFPPLVQSEWALGIPERVVAIILNGMSGEIEVKGETFNSVMTPFGSLLDDREIAGVATYVRTNPEWGHEASEVTEEMVGGIRAQYERATQWKVEEILRIFPFEQ